MSARIKRLMVQGWIKHAKVNAGYCEKQIEECEEEERFFWEQEKQHWLDFSHSQRTLLRILEEVHKVEYSTNPFTYN